MPTLFYSKQLTRLSEALQLQWFFSGKSKRKIILFHANTRSHVAKTTRAVRKDWELGLGSFTRLGFIWLPFVLVNHFFKEKSWKYQKRHIFVFDKKGIQSLVERWEKVILNDGNYFHDWRFIILFLWVNKIKKNKLIAQPKKYFCLSSKNDEAGICLLGVVTRQSQYTW